MNLAAMRQAVYDRCGSDANTDTLLAPDKINRFVNAALHYVEVLHSWSWLERAETIATVSAVETVTPSPDWRFTIELKDDAGRVLDGFGTEYLDDRWRTGTSGKPREYAMFGGLIYLRPVPDGIYQLSHRYLRSEVDLVADTDVPLIDDPLSTMVIEYATFLALRRDRNDPRAEEALKAYQMWESRAQRWEQPVTRPGKVRIRPGAWL